MTHAIAQLRHLYAQLLKGEVEPQAEAAKYLLGPAIETLEHHESDLAALRAAVEALAGEWEERARDLARRAARPDTDFESTAHFMIAANLHRKDADALRALLPGGDASRGTWRLPQPCPACDSPEKWGDQHAPWCKRLPGGDAKEKP